MRWSTIHTAADAKFIKGSTKVLSGHSKSLSLRNVLTSITGWTSSRANVTNLVKANLVGAYADYNLVVTGGSLGGALAALAYADFKTNTNLGLSTKTVRGFSFGEPRVGNFLFAKWFNGFTGASPGVVGNWLRVTHGYGELLVTTFGLRVSDFRY